MDIPHTCTYIFIVLNDACFLIDCYYQGNSCICSQLFRDSLSSTYSLVIGIAGRLKLLYAKSTYDNLQVVCSKCSSFKASLAYECGKSVRVCRTCHATLQELSSSTATPSPEIDEGDECSLYSAKEPLDLPFRNRGVLEVCTGDALNVVFTINF